MVQGLESKFKGFEFRVQLRVQFRVQDLYFRVQGSRFSRG
jgi:hypothetical protein